MRYLGWLLLLGSLALGCGRLGYESLNSRLVATSDDTSGGSAGSDDTLDASTSAPRPPMLGPDTDGLDAGGDTPAPTTPSPTSDAGFSVPPEADSGASTTCPQDALLCDSFDMDLSQWTLDLNGGEATLDTGLAWSGPSSVRLLAPSQRTHARLRGPLQPALMAGPLYVRFHAYLSSDITITEWNVIFEWWRDGDKVSFDFVQDRFQIHVGGYGSQSAGTIPRDRWFCVLMEIEVAEQGSVALSVDGEPLVQVTGDTLPNAGIEELWLSSHAPMRQRTPTEVHVDEFIAATTPLACP